MPTVTSGAKAPKKTVAKKKAAPTDSVAVDLLRDLKAKINKQVKGAHCEVMGESDIANVES